MGKHRTANVRREEGEAQVTALLQGKSINPFIDEEFIEKSKPHQITLGEPDADGQSHARDGGGRDWALGRN